MQKEPDAALLQAHKIKIKDQNTDSNLDLKAMQKEFDAALL